MPWYKTTVTSGKYRETYEYFSRREADSSDYIPRGPNENQTGEDQQAKNAFRSWKQAHRLLCCNFSMENGDMFLTVTFKGGTSEAEAQKARQAFFKNAGRKMREKDLPFKWLSVKEKQDQWHFHIVMSGGLTLHELQGCLEGSGWIKGWVVDDSDLFAGLSHYFMDEYKPKKGERPSSGNNKQPRRKFERRWTCSRNLKRPDIQRVRIPRPPSPGIPKPEKGYRLLPTWIVGCDGFGNLFRRFECVWEGLAEKKKRPKKRRSDKKQ